MACVQQQEQQHGQVELCRLCGGQEGKLLHLTDTFSTLGTTSTILHLLHSISVFLKVQNECEPLMPHHLCWHCFNMAVDINAFIDSGINFQRTTVSQFLPVHDVRIEETPCNSLPAVSTRIEETPCNSLPAVSTRIEETSCNSLPAVSTRIEETPCNSLPAVSTRIEETHCNSLPPILAPGNKGPEVVEEREVVLRVMDDQASVNPMLTMTKGEVRVGCYQSTQNSLSIASESKMSQESDGSSSLLCPAKVNDTPGEAEAIITEENCDKQLQEVEGNTSQDHEDGNQHQGNKHTVEDAKRSAARHEREKCSFCNKTFQRPSQLKSHLASHSEARPHQCQVCGVAFKHRRNLVEHTHTHSQQPSFICAVCGLTFKQKSNLLKHERTHWRGSVPGYRCNVCGNQYSQSSHLKTHIKNAHGDNPGFRCEQCNVVLLRRSSLRRHLATVHAATTRFTCPHCSKGFTNQQNFQGHVRSHTGERPYRCLTCSKAFTTPKALSRHRMIHQGTKTHKCTQCGKAFLELCDLKRHIKRHQQKSAKRAKATVATDGCQEGTTEPPDPSVGSINLMVLTDSLIFTESQQLLDNPEPRPEQVILSNGKVNGSEEVAPAAVLEGGPPAIQLPKKPHVEVLAPGPLLPATPDMEAVLQPPVIGDMAAPLHPGQVLQPTTIDVQDGATTSQVDLGHRECSGGPVAADTPTMVVLASASTPAEFLPDPEPRSGARPSSPVGDVGERVLSHATW